MQVSFHLFFVSDARVVPIPNRPISSRRYPRSSNNIMSLTVEQEVELFKELIRIRTISAEGPNGAYQECCDWLVKTAKKLVPSMETTIVSPVENKPIVVCKLEGRQPDLEAILLNAHYDVVPVMDEHWDTDPFAAEEKDGNIYGRGTQDMKCVTIQYLLALGRLTKESGGKPIFERNMFISFVPDEEIGGKDGMGAFIESGEFKQLCPNVACALDEGLATPEAGKNTVFFGERLPMWIQVFAKGPTGHGSRFIKDTAISKLIDTANAAFAKRREQEEILGYGASLPQDDNEAGCKHCEAKKLGDVLTINLTVLQAGVSADGGKTFAMNVIPTEAMAGFDIRVPVTMPMPEVKAMLDDWTKAEGMSWRVNPDVGNFKDFDHAVTSTDPEKNKWWKLFSEACSNAELQAVPEIFPAGTDSRFLRMKGISAFGFSPMSGSPIMLHEHNEFIERETFVKGIEIYEKILPELANAE
mmetsp:Transcript_8988/g.16594  ORF Transcript_8988/g.16594 Transcript_8988/m.16594 type:complete len:471 (-) Transcript_8988:76-1488(-)